MVGAVRLDRRELELRDGIVRKVAVLPGYQGRGIGSTMMLEVEKTAAAIGLTRLRTSSAPDATGFYLKLGWEVVDGSRGCPLMSKTLARQETSA